MTIPQKSKPTWQLPYQTQMRLFLLPYLLGTLILVVIPAVATVLISFTEYKAIGVPKFVLGVLQRKNVIQTSAKGFFHVFCCE